MTLTKLYCYVVRRSDGAKVAGFPDSGDTDRPASTKDRLRGRLLDVLSVHGHHQSAYKLAVHAFDGDTHLYDVEAT